MKNLLRLPPSPSLLSSPIYYVSLTSIINLLSNGVNSCFSRRRFEGDDTSNSSNVILGERERNKRRIAKEGYCVSSFLPSIYVSLAIRNYAAQGPLTAKLRSWFFHGAIFYPGFTVDAPTRERERERKR